MENVSDFVVNKKKNKWKGKEKPKKPDKDKS